MLLYLSKDGCREADICSINMGRAPARRVFNNALEVLVANSDKVREFVTHKLPVTEAAKGYEIFEKQQARKVVLVF